MNTKYKMPTRSPYANVAISADVDADLCLLAHSLDVAIMLRFGVLIETRRDYRAILSPTLWKKTRPGERQREREKKRCTDRVNGTLENERTRRSAIVTSSLQSPHKQLQAMD